MAGAGLQLLEERLAEDMAADDAENGRSFDPMTIFTIITALLPLIQNCFAPKPSALRRRLFNRSRVANALRREDQSLSWSDSMRKADRLFDLADKATDEELQSLIEDCCNK